MALGTSNPFPRSIGSFQVPVVAPTGEPDAEPLTTVCFSQEWLPYVIGALQQLTLQATWQGDDDAVTLAVNQAQLLVAMFGSSAGGCVNAMCIDGVVYDPDCDCIIWTPPGSSEGIENPTLDPRHSDGLRFPPNDAEDQKCQAAANMTRFISDLISEVVLVVDNAGNAEGLIAIILPFVIELGPFGILIELVLALAFVLFSAGATAIASAFTSDVYDQLTCIFFCNISADGSVTAEQLSTIVTAIDSEIGGLVSTVLGAMFFLMGEVGLSNSGAVGDAPADCSSCDCPWCLTVDLRDNDGGFEAFVGGAGTYATYVPGEGWRSNYFAPPEFDHVQALIVCLEFDTARLTQIGWETDGYGVDNASNDLYADCVLSDLRSSGSPWTGDEDWNVLSTYSQWYPDATATQYIYLRAFSLRGTGDIPDLPGWTVCEE